MRTLRLLAIALAALFSAHCMKAASPVEPLECRLEAVHPLVAGGPVALRFRLANRTDGPLWVLRWNTPIEGWRGTIFTVTFQGAELPYRGPMVKRGDPGAEEYVKVTPETSINVSLDLAEAYDVKRPGKYEVKVTGSLLDVTKDAAAVPHPRDRQQPMALQCAPLTLDVH
ncbi:MAG TPA: protease [Thermoanaerobaculia bacterium]|nr:protease [Thermoanaerobaculia bacterium]